jgi:peptidoglycan/LPS O-acetylase OafA/YrhL
MDSIKVKRGLTIATGIWLLIPGIAGVFLGGLTPIDCMINPSRHDDMRVFLVPLSLPIFLLGALFIFAGIQVIKRKHWLLSFICSIFLFIILALLELIWGYYSFWCWALAVLPIVFPIILFISKTEFK